MIFNARFDTKYGESEASGFSYPTIVGAECLTVGVLVTEWGDQFGVVLRLDHPGDRATDILLSEEDSEAAAIILAEKINKIFGEAYRKAKPVRGVLHLHIKDVIDVVALSEAAMKEADAEEKAAETTETKKKRVRVDLTDADRDPDPNGDDEDGDDEDNEDAGE